MIQLFGIRESDLPSMEILQAQMDADWLAAWKIQHQTLSGDHARISLGGLFLLAQSGAKGRLIYSENRKPSFLDSNTHFSITHTDGTVFCAVSDRGSVGLDAENLSRISESKMIALANRWFGKEELRFFLKSPAASTFLRIWTRKEAYVKRTGEGLRQLRQVDTFDLSVREPVSFTEFWVEETCVNLCADAKADVAENIIFVTF